MLLALISVRIFDGSDLPAFGTKSETAFSLQPARASAANSKPVHAMRAIIKCRRLSRPVSELSPPVFRGAHTLAPLTLKKCLPQADRPSLTASLLSRGWRQICGGNEAAASFYRLRP